jgi:Na+/citrate or Na+/malate symporter
VPRRALTEAVRRCLEFLPIEATITAGAVVDHKRGVRAPLP